ncbi:hypothetical protein DRO32_01910 [Candidatus Bathyarchaeota archaeon]|nr:MAG: hypothetical protein DRO32_01910 [Candidatus Bathyarchaeota archaeon]
MRRRARLLVAANFVASVGWGLCWPYLTFRLYDIGAVYLQIALMDSLAYATYLLSRLWGALSDYYGRRKPFMLLGFTASALPVAFMALLNDRIWALISSYLAACFAWGIAFPALVAALTSEPDREYATAIFSLVGSVGWGIGAFLMGPAEEYMGPAGLFGMSFLILLAFPLVLAFYDEEELPRKEGPLRSYLAGALSLEFRARRGFGLLLVGVFLGWLGLQWASPLMRLKIYDALGRSKMSVGLIMGLNSIISALAVSLGGKLVRRLGGLRTLISALACYAIIMPVFALAREPGLLLALWFVPIWPFFNLGYMLSPAEFSSEEERAEAVGSCEVMKSMGVLLGLLGGYVADLIGRERSLVLSAIPLSLAIPPSLASYRARRADDAPRPSPSPSS